MSGDYSKTDDGVVLIHEERDRQENEEGYTAEHDDTHERGELLDAATAYIRSAAGKSTAPGCWPWSDGFKPEGAIKDLVRAGALIAAEIDRRLRAGETR